MLSPDASLFQGPLGFRRTLSQCYIEESMSPRHPEKLPNTTGLSAFRRSSRRLRSAAIVMAICAMAGCRDRPAAPTVAEADAAAAAWRTEHEADYRRDWVSISGLATLKPGVNTAGSATTNDIVLPDSTPATVGRFVLGDAGVRFEPAPGAGVLLKKSPVSGPIELHEGGAGATK